MGGDSPSLFDGFSAEEYLRVVSRLKRRWLPANEFIIAEGDERHEIYVIEAGTARVFARDRYGVEHTINHVGPGAAIGEISFFTGQPASATVIAITDLNVLVITAADFDNIAAAFPRFYYNLGAILSQRLARISRRSVQSGPRRISVLLDYGAPPLLGYALACSVAWHTRSPTLLLVVAEGSPASELTALAANAGAGSAPSDQTAKFPSTTFGPLAEGRAHLRIVTPTDSFAAHVLAATVDELLNNYDHVLVQLSVKTPIPATPGRRVRLCGEGSVSSDCAAAWRNDHAAYTLTAWENSIVPKRLDGERVLGVPPLIPGDERAMRDGFLPVLTPAGKALGWAARDLSGLKVGLALGAGSARGYAHIGVLKVLHEAGLTVDYLVGSSIGAATATLHALGLNPDEIGGVFDRLGAEAVRLTLPTRSLLSIDKLRRGLHKICGETRFEDLRLPLAVVATDIVTGNEIVFDKGPILPPVMASIAIPGVYPPQQIGTYTLVDGGVVNPVPSNVAVAMGADTVIAVKLNRRATALGERRAEGFPAQPVSLLRTILRAIEIMQGKIFTEAGVGSTIMIEPVFDNVKEYRLRSFTQARSYTQLGESAARAALPRITSALPWLREEPPPPS
jgi:NTE family protein